VPTRKVLYCLAHASSSFSSDYFGDRVLLFAQASLDQDLAILHLLCSSWDSGCMSTHPAFFHQNGVSRAFLPRLDDYHFKPLKYGNLL
jgi:hypothetical protein